MKKPVKTGDLDALITGVQNAYDLKGIELLNKALIGLGIKESASQEQLLKESPHPLSISYGKFYNHLLYQNVLPLCELAYLGENNGNAKEHAFKLATIFDQEQKVLAYLYKFKDVNSYNYLVHDACLFDLPEPDACNFRQWHKLAQINLLNPRFRELFSHAIELEKIGHTGRYIKKHFIDQQKIEQKKKELLEATKHYKNESTKPTTQLDENQRNKRQKQLSQLSNDIAEQRRALTVLCQGLRLEAIDMLVLEAFYESYRHNQKIEHKVLVAHGISSKNIAKFHTLKRCNDDDAIPNILIDGETLGYSGIYLKKLDTLSDKGAALAACLGKITHCCQYMGGAGESCAIHGITSPNGGFYVVCKGDANNPSLDDPILAQSWAWKGRNHGICFDSIEAASSNILERQLTADLFRFLGHLLCQKYNIPYVNTGNQSGITREIGVKNHITMKEYFLDYDGYCDSINQLPLANKAIPYLLYGQAHSTNLKNIIAQETKSFFYNLFDTQNALKKCKPLKQAIIFILQTKCDELLNLLNQTASSFNCRNEFENLYKVNDAYRYKLDNEVVDLDLIAQGADIDMLNKNGYSALHLAVDSQDLPLMKILIGHGISIDILGPNNITALSMATGNGDADIFDYLLKNGAKLDVTTMWGDNLLLTAAQNNKQAFVTIILANPQCNTEMLQQQNDRGNTALMYSAQYGYTEIAQQILVSLYCSPEVLQKENIEKMTALMLAAENGYTEVVQAILASPHCRAEMLGHKNHEGNNVLIIAVRENNEKVVEAIVASPHCTAELLMQKGNCDYNALAEATGKGNINSVKAILANPYCSSEMLMQQRSYNGNNALILAAEICDPGMGLNTADIIEAILASPHCNAEMLMQQNNRGNNALIAVATRRKEVRKFEAILHSQHCSTGMLMQKNNDGNNALMAAIKSGNIKVVEAILASPHCNYEMIIQLKNDHKIDIEIQSLIMEKIRLFEEQDKFKNQDKHLLNPNHFFADKLDIISQSSELIRLSPN